MYLRLGNLGSELAIRHVENGGSCPSGFVSAGLDNNAIGQNGKPMVQCQEIEAPPDQGGRQQDLQTLCMQDPQNQWIVPVSGPGFCMPKLTPLPPLAPLPVYTPPPPVYVAPAAPRPLPPLVPISKPAAPIPTPAKAGIGVGVIALAAVGLWWMWRR